MVSTVWMATRRWVLATTVLVATAASLGALAGVSTAAARDVAMTPKAQALHDDMRALWEAHGTWTERAIVDFVGGVPDAQLAIARLLQNQTDIGNAVKPFYGRKAGNQLTALLKEHINTAVGVLQAAASGDSQAIARAKAAFFANGDQVARFLHAANPRHWSVRAMQRMMRIHLNQVIALAVDQLQGDYEGAIRLYDFYIAHIIDMADMLSSGIIEQFPARLA
jgi:hypothetical protein